MATDNASSVACVGVHVGIIADHRARRHVFAERSSALRRALIVFARAPEAGRVKTRLAAVVGIDEALAIYRELGTTVMNQVSVAPCACSIAFTPDDGEVMTRAWLGAGPRYIPQGTGDLGARMARMIRTELENDAERVAVIGTDCPTITANDIDDAFSALDHSDVVFGPAADGGYWLVGVRNDQPAIFHGIEWSTPQTLAQSVTRAHEAGLRVALLEEKLDVDTVSDLRAWRASAG